MQEGDGSRATTASTSTLVGGDAETPCDVPEPDAEATQFNIDDLVPQTWSSEARARLAEWRQGDLLRHPGISWLGPAGDDHVTGTPGGEWEYAPVAAPDLSAPYGVIASQTCDIGADGPGRKHPFVDMHPVFDRSDLNEGQRKQIRDYGVRYLLALTDPGLPEGFWVADLRLTMSVSKAQLLEVRPVCGFANEVDRLKFAAVLGHKRRRPALHDVLSADLPALLDAHIQQKDKSGHPPDWYTCVEQVRLQITGDRLAPDQVSLTMIHDHPMPAELRHTWREATKRIVNLLKPADLRFGAMAFVDLNQMSARAYRDSVLLPLEGLRRAPDW